MEPLLWLLSPFVFTTCALVVIVMRRRSRPTDLEDRQERRRAELKRVERALSVANIETSSVP